MQDDIRTRKIKRNVLAMIGIKGLSLLISLAYVPLLLHSLNSVNYGIWLTLTSIVGWVAMFDVGLGHGLRNRLSEALACGNVYLGKQYVSTAYVGICLAIIFFLLIFLFVSNCFLSWNNILKEFYPHFLDTLKTATENINNMKDFFNEETDFVCEKCGKKMIKRLGRYGYFIACSGFPECKNTKGISFGVCPKCGGELPLNIGTAKSYPIAIIGAKETGKSNYVAVLINQLKNEIGRSFNCALMACGDKTLNRYRTEFYDPLYRHRTCVRGSDAGDVDPLIYSLIFQRKGGLFKKAVNDAVSLTFFDTAGENLNSLASMQTFNRYLYHSSGIILLLDPLQLPTVRDELQGKIRLPEENTDVNTILNRTIEIIRTGSGLTDLSKKIDIPIAIAFTKIDAVDELLDPASCLKNDSSHIRKGVFDKIDFQDANNEMQSLVESWLGMELYQTVSTQFSNFAFFGLSALGSNPDMDNKIPKFRPFRVADPFLWILSQEQIIPTE